MSYLNGYHRLRICISLLILIAFLIVLSCKGQDAAPKQVKQSHVAEYSKESEAYQDLQAELYEYKSSIESHVRINEMTKDSSDPLDEGTNDVSKNKIIELSNKMLEICNTVEGNSNYINLTSGQKANIKKYEQFANNTLNKYK